MLQPPHPAPCHSAPQNQIRPQLVLSISESLATVAVTVPTRATIAVYRSPAEPRQWVTHCEKLLEIARNDPTFADCTAATPRWGTPPSRDGVEPSRLRLDSTISPSSQGAVVATRYPLFIQRKVSPPPTIQIKKEEERRSLLSSTNTTKPAIVAQENYTLSATSSLLATFVLLLRQPFGDLPRGRCRWWRVSRQLIVPTGDLDSAS